MKNCKKRASKFFTHMGSKMLFHLYSLSRFTLTTRLVVVVVLFAVVVLDREHRDSACVSKAAAGAPSSASVSSAPPPAPSGPEDRDRTVEARRGQGSAGRMPGDVADGVQLAEAVVVVGRRRRRRHRESSSSVSVFFFLFFSPARPRRGPVSNTQPGRQGPHELPRGEIPDADPTVF